ncbi:unnamed protein product [Echinostoma caproni]|uniref:Uncharacterized protein n=1 Tax=Echinostoma caproni TaxID=27848 RepID=A0A3P8GVW5_9TREM|nr:unnamed protein product [Echinostoma caproni]
MMSLISGPDLICPMCSPLQCTRHKPEESRVMRPVFWINVQETLSLLLFSHSGHPDD